MSARHSRLASLCVLLVGLLTQSSPADTLTHLNSHPEIQMWSYPAADGAAGVRDRGSTFSAYLAVDEDTGETYSYPGSGADPSRRAAIVIASDTSADIPSGLAPQQYQVESLRLKATLLGSLIFEEFGYTLSYDNTLDDPAALTGESGDEGFPIEMYGVGLQGDYGSISFDAAPDATALQLGDVRWRQFQEGEAGYDHELPANEQAVAPYQYFAVDSQGRDAENSVAGGYSATEESGHTDAFTPTPFAIGKLYNTDGSEYAPGTHLASGDEFIFEPDLSDPGVLQYVQESLASGALAFSFSSMHQPDGQFGAVPYPDFYLDDLDAGNNPDGAAPEIELSVTIIDSLPGDYDGSGMVDNDDYLLWRSQYSGVGPDADGNGDGVVDAADYSLWRDNLSPASAGLTAANAAPEPAGLAVLSLVGAAAVFCGWAGWIARPKRAREDNR